MYKRQVQADHQGIVVQRCGTSVVPQVPEHCQRNLLGRKEAVGGQRPGDGALPVAFSRRRRAVVDAVAADQQPVARFDAQTLSDVLRLFEHPQRELRVELAGLDAAPSLPPHPRGSRVHSLHLARGQVEAEEQDRRVQRASVLGVDSLVGEAGLAREAEAGAPGVAQRAHDEIGQEGRLHPRAHAVGDGEGEVMGRDRPVEVVAEDRVRGLQMGAQLEFGAGHGAARQQLPLHLRGQGQPRGAPGEEVEVGVPFGDQDLVAERLTDLLHLRQVRPGETVLRPGDGENPEPVPPDGHRQMYMQGAGCGPGLHIGLLDSEGATLWAVMNVHRLGERRL